MPKREKIKKKLGVKNKTKRTRILTKNTTKKLDINVSEILPRVKLSNLKNNWKKLHSVKQIEKTTRSASTKKMKKVKRLKFNFKVSDKRKIGQYMYKNIIKNTSTKLLYDAGIHLKSQPVLKFSAKKKKATDLFKIKLLAKDLKAADDIDSPLLPNIDHIIKKARLYYKEKKIVPLIIVDVDYGKLTKSATKKLMIDSLGVLHFDKYDSSSIEQKNCFAFAPIIDTVGYKNVSMIIKKDFIFTNKKIPKSYYYSIDNSSYKKINLNQVFNLKISKANVKHRISISPQRDHQDRLLYSFMSATPVPRPDLFWEGEQVLDSERDERTWITAHVYFAFNRDTSPGAPEIQNPIVILGGFSPNFEEYALMYHELSRIRFQGLDLITALRQAYDVILLTYADIEASIVLNSHSLSSIIHDINDRNVRVVNGETIHDGIILVGISMGGLVTRLTLAGMENGFLDPPEHRVKLWISIDAPHQGAHIPLAYQYMISELGVLMPFTDQLGIVDKLSSTSAKEMLIEHIDGIVLTTPDETFVPASNEPQGTAERLPSEILEHISERNMLSEILTVDTLDRITSKTIGKTQHATERDEFLDILYEWGDFPHDVRHTVAISSGSLWANRASQAWWNFDPSYVTSMNGRDYETFKFVMHISNWEPSFDNRYDGEDADRHFYGEPSDPDAVPPRWNLFPDNIARVKNESDLAYRFTYNTDLGMSILYAGFKILVGPFETNARYIDLK